MAARKVAKHVIITYCSFFSYCQKLQVKVIGLYFLLIIFFLRRFSSLQFVPPHFFRYGFYTREICIAGNFCIRIY